ncbi:MAG: class I mannose-6-phosphate isomerase [Victivallaceae bacterium]|nr:class I mannose-6-phosphate isomerase [Victivallaceae bacterium]
MSFMFNPYPYEDLNPVNRPVLSEQTVTAIAAGLPDTAAQLAAEIINRQQTKTDVLTVCMDGYVGADWRQLVNLLTGELVRQKFQIRVFNVASCYKSSRELDATLAPYLPQDRERDPVLLFGRLFEGGYECLFDAAKLTGLKQSLAAGPGTINIVYGAGACSEELRSFSDIKVYLDLTPKQAVLRVKNGSYKNLGDKYARPFREAMRRCYYFDFELAMHLRAELLKKDLLDFYIAGDCPEKIQLIPQAAFNEICAALVRYPFRCKPVYLEGVWGGYYIKKLRGLPAEMKNCAWIFDLIPLEVSLLIEAGNQLVEIPFFTFVCKEGVTLMGQECVDTFNGYFPIRFNYDDTYHSSGNMSIQLHPGTEYIKENFNEHGRQDESYYVIVTGHGARTFVGLREGEDANAFIAATKKSEKDFSPVDYEKHVNYLQSRPGMQFLLPAGTIHSSGRNQLILEIGSLTVGSYTFKMYDYLRPDLDGVPRPIHTYHGERTLETGRTSSWVSKNLVQEPKLLRSGPDGAEYALGEHELLYFSLYRYEFEKRIEGNTGGVFHVLNLVDGEAVTVYPKAHPERCYQMNYLDMVVVPANVGEYVIENLGNQPVCIHKTCLKKNFAEYV